MMEERKVVEKQALEDKTKMEDLMQGMRTCAEPNEADKSNTDICVICLESISERARIVPCDHSNFDFVCLSSWLEQQAVCPLCKTEARLVAYGKKSSGNACIVAVPRPISPAKASASAPTMTDLITSEEFYPDPHLWANFRIPEVSLLDRDDEGVSSLRRRRRVYFYNAYSSHVGSNLFSRFRELTPQDFLTNPQLVSRARRWITRELQVFSHLGADSSTQGAGTSWRENDPAFLLEYIIGILKSVEIKGGQAEDLIQEYLGRTVTRLFLHELRAWLRSPYIELRDWDRNVQYNLAEEFEEYHMPSILRPEEMPQLQNLPRGIPVSGRERQTVMQARRPSSIPALPASSRQHLPSAQNPSAQ